MGSYGDVSGGRGVKRERAKKGKVFERICQRDVIDQAGELYVK
jgi:hypothetical protein